MTLGFCAIVSAGCAGHVTSATADEPAHSPGWGCAFPKEADDAGVDDALVRVKVQIGSDGIATGATLIGRDPGYGFAAAAVECAGRQHFVAALDRTGRPVPATMALWIHFIRPPPASPFP